MPTPAKRRAFKNRSKARFTAVEDDFYRDCPLERRWLVARLPDSQLPDQEVPHTGRGLFHLKHSWAGYGHDGLPLNDLTMRLTRQVTTACYLRVFAEPGWHFSNNQWVFAHGGEVLGPEGTVASVVDKLPPVYLLSVTPTPDYSRRKKAGRPVGLHTLRAPHSPHGPGSLVVLGLVAPVGRMPPAALRDLP